MENIKHKIERVHYVSRFEMRELIYSNITQYKIIRFGSSLNNKLDVMISLSDAIKQILNHQLEISIPLHLMKAI